VQFVCDAVNQLTSAEELQFVKQVSGYQRASVKARVVFA